MIAALPGGESDDILRLPTKQLDEFENVGADDEDVLGAGDEARP